MRAHVVTILCKFGSDRAIFGIVVAIPAKKFTDTQTDRRQTPRDCISSWNELKMTTADQLNGSQAALGRPRSLRTADNVPMSQDMICSQDDASCRHINARKIQEHIEHCNLASIFFY